MATMANPMAAAWLPSRRRENARGADRDWNACLRLGETNTWVEEAIQHVDDGVGGHEQRRDYQDTTLHDRVVALIDRVEQKPSQPGQGEDLLYHHRAAEQVTHLNAQDRDHHDHAVLQCMALNNCSPGKSFCVS